MRLDNSQQKLLILQQTGWVKLLIKIHLDESPQGSGGGGGGGHSHTSVLYSLASMYL